MKLGIAIFPADFAIRPDELARAVEERGFESLFFTDHTHIPATPQTRKLMQDTQGGVQPHFTHNYDPFVAIAYAAAATQTLRLGTGVCLVPEREPIATAKTVASLDVLSHGRVLLGVGVGWIPEAIANHGIDPPTRWAVMDERVQAMRAIWTQDEAEYHGRHLEFEPIWSWPKPHQRPTRRSSSVAPATASSVASSPTATNGCPTPACPSSSSVRGSASSRTPHGRQVATATFPSRSKAPNPTPVR
jgi:probable F420-dependent oxidoreductase